MSGRVMGNGIGKVSDQRGEPLREVSGVRPAAFAGSMSLGSMSSGSMSLGSMSLGPESLGSSPNDDDDAIEDLELDDPTIDEAGLPHLDIDDPEALGQEVEYGDLLDRGLLERSADADAEDDGAVLEDIGLTIDLDGPAGEEEGAQVVDLDFGSLLTPLPSEVSEIELDPLGHERDAVLGVGVLRDMLLPESDEDVLDDDGVLDEERFPAFDDAADIAPRPSLEDEDIHRDELS